MIENKTLQAYHDGELSPVEAREVESKLAEDRQARAILERLASLDRDLGHAFEPPLHEPPPSALLAQVNACLTGSLRRPLARPTAGTGAFLIGALAAAVLLLLSAAPLIWALSSERASRQVAILRSGEAVQQLAGRGMALASLQQALSETLETRVSGEPTLWQSSGGSLWPVSTFKSRDGQWCREYRVEIVLAGAPYAEHGVACRQADGIWVRRVLLLDPETGVPRGASALPFPMESGEEGHLERDFDPPAMLPGPGGLPSETGPGTEPSKNEA